MKGKKLFYFLIIAIVWSCSKQENIPYELLETKHSGDEVQSERIRVINESVNLTYNDGFKSSAAPTSFTQESQESSPEFDCDESITESFSGSKRIDNKDVVCLENGTTFNGSVELRGGTFVIKGNATISSISGNKGTIVITETGSVNFQNLNLGSNYEIINYGTQFEASSFTISGEFENHGSALVGQLTVNGGGSFENKGEFTVSGNMVNNKDVENEGTLTVAGNLTINGGATLENKCKLIVEGNVQNNKTLENDAYTWIGGTLTINGGGEVKFGEQAYLYSEALSLSGTLEGSNRGYGRIDINGSSTLNWGARITKKIDFNDADGIEVSNGRYDNSVTFDEAITINTTDCNPGVYQELANPQYTLIAEITVPELLGKNLSATDISFGNNLAIVSYHLNGIQFGGAIDLVDLSSVSTPLFTMNYLSEAKEFNAITLSGNRLYMAGQRNIDESDYKANDTKGALLYTTELIDGDVFNIEEIWTETPMPSFSGNAVKVLENGQLLFASGASGGGFFRLSSNGTDILESNLFDYAKYIASEGNTEVRLAGGPGEARLIIVEDGLSSEVLLGASAAPVDGKNVVVLDNGMAYVTLGENGLVVVDISEKEVVGRYQPAVSGLTNGVAVDEDFVYLANGESGLLLLRKNSLELYAQYEYNGSANLVALHENIILIANGTGGVKILARNI